MKSLKKIIIKNKLIVGMLIALLILSAGTFYYINYRMDKSVKQPPISTEENKQQNTQTDDNQIQSNVDNKKRPEENTPNDTTPNTPQSTNSTDLANSVSLQGLLNEDKQSASVSLYGMAASYSVDKLSGETWTKVVDNSFYGGRGGLLVDTINANSPSLTTTYRVYPVIDGARSTNFATVDVNWNLIRSSGVSSFKGAQAN